MICRIGRRITEPQGQCPSPIYDLRVLSLWDSSILGNLMLSLVQSDSKAISNMYSN